MVLENTHNIYCKANQPELRPTPMPKLERTATIETIALLVPLEEQTAAFILNQRKLKQTRREKH